MCFHRGTTQSHRGATALEDRNIIICAFVSVNVDTWLDPIITLYRDTSEDLYTADVVLSDNFDLYGIDFSVDTVLGWTENTQTTSTTYYGAGLGASKRIKQNVYLGADVTWSDTDSRDDEFVYGTSLTIKF